VQVSRKPRRAVTVCAAAAATLTLTAAAAGHVTLSPPFVEAGERTTVSFETPNERERRATTSLEIVAPHGVEFEAAPAPTGWTVVVEPAVARWTGGRIEGTDVVSFPLVVTARTPAGPAAFAATQGYDDGEIVRWRAALTVLPARDPPPQHLRRALVASAAGLVLLVGSLATLRVLRRRSLQER
jgi:uncharacterized protein YcnI